MHDVIFFLVGHASTPKSVANFSEKGDHQKRFLEKMHQINYSEKSKIFFENSL